MLRRSRKNFGASLALLAMSIPGCASKPSGGWFGGGSSSSGLAQSSPAQFFQGQQSPVMAQANPTPATTWGANPNGPAMTPPSGSSFSVAATGAAASVGGAFRRAGGAVSNALTIQPKVIPADDPVSLSHSPRKLGYEVYTEAGKLYEGNGNFELAQQNYERALQIAPQHVPTMISLAHLFDRQGKFDQAVEMYHRAAKAEPINPTIYNDLGLCLARQRKYPESIDALKRAADLVPDKKLYRNNLATVYVELGRNEEALAQLTTAHGAATANYNLGHMLHSRQQTTLAAEHFRRAAELQPGFVQANQMLAQLSGPVTQFAGYSGNTAGAVENGIGSRPDTSAQNRPTPVPNNPAVAAPKDARLEESQIALPTGSKIKISAPIYPTDGNGSDSNQPQNGLRTSTPISAPPSVAPQVSNEKKILLPPSSSEPIEPAADQSLYPSTGHGGPPLNAPTAVPATQPSSRDLTPPSENFPSLLPPVEPSR